MIAYTGSNKILNRMVDVLNELTAFSEKTHLTQYDSDSVLTSLSDIPVNTFGHIVLGSGISPFTDTGTDTSCNYLCFAQSNTQYRTLQVQRLTDSVTYINAMNNGSWAGWKQITNG